MFRADFFVAATKLHIYFLEFKSGFSKPFLHQISICEMYDPMAGRGGLRACAFGHAAANPLSTRHFLPARIQRRGCGSAKRPGQNGQQDYIFYPGRNGASYRTAPDIVFAANYLYP
jgi:hypothetical protein